MPEWIPIAVALLCVALACAPRKDAAGRVAASPKSVRRFVRSAGSPQWQGDVRLAERLGARETAASRGSLLLLVVAFACGMAIPALRDNPAWGIALVSAHFLGRALGPVAAAVKRALTPLPADSPRVARAVTPRVGDHVAPGERVGGVAALLPGVLTTAAAVAASAGLVDGEAISWGVLVALSVAAPVVPAAVEYLAARLARAPRPAAAVQDLAWEDALRAQSLRELYRGSAVVVLCLAVGTLTLIETGVLGGWPEDPVRGVTISAVMVLLVLTPAYAGAAMMAAPGRRFRERLWPHGCPQGPHPSAGGTA